MEKELEKYLKLLNSERCLKRPKEAIVILDKISKCFTNESSQFTLGILISLVLDDTDALLTFIWKASATFETVTCVSASFKLLDYLVTNFQKCMEPYFPILYQKCLHLLDGKFAKVKEVSLKLIKNIIEADSKHTLDLLKLVLKIEKCLREEAKICATVAGEIFSLFGYLFEKYPESVKNEKWLLSKMIESLKKESSTTKDPSLVKVKGAFEGINGYLITYPPPDAVTLRKTYEFIKRWSKYREDKKAVSRTCLNILHNHWRHFSSFIFNDKDFWRLNLDVWIHQNSVDSQLAFKVLCSLYSVIALFSKQEGNNSEINIYINEFTKCLESSSNVYERKAALVGIKLLILTECLTPVDFNRTYETVMNFIKNEESSNGLTYLPVCIECLSAFVLKFSGEDLHMEHLSFLQRLSVKLIENYPDFEPEFQPNALVALEKSFYMMGLSNLQVTVTYVERVLYQGLIRTCSCMTLAELELLVETGRNPKCVCYKSFVGLWKYLLTLASNPNLPVGGSLSVKKGIATKVFDTFFVSFLRIVSNLDFSVGSEMEVEKPSDLHIFVNIVDLYQDLLPLIDSFSLQKWLMELFKTVIYLTYRNPLLSGFYKITAANLKISDVIHFFDDSATEKCFELVRKFLEDILTKVDHYKGDLQLACLKVLLAAPVNLIEDLVEKALPALEIVAQLSRSSLPLLKDLIETLERWDLHLPASTSHRIMKKILPLLDVFFQSPYFRGKNSVDSSKEGKKLKLQVVFNDSEFLTLQKKFLVFLGNLEISKGLNLIELSDAEERRKVSDKPLLYPLPCGKGWVEIHLDEMIVRAVELAQSCGDRETRITACELLYSFVIVIIGNVNQLSGGYTYLFRKVMKTCLVLSCDPDGLVCQIFEPLMYQVAHYLSGKQALHFSETEDLIDILTEGVACSINPSVRDFSSDLLREFTVWSIKQLSPEELRTTPESAKRILKKIYSLALHPNYNKRLGAAVIFNRIYSVLREEDSILNNYWFQLFYYFMESLKMCEDHEDVTEIIEAIYHVERPLVEKRKEFNADSPDRVVPPEFNGRRLCHLVKWTMVATCDVKPAVRHTAMALVQKLAPLLDYCDPNLFFTSKLLQNFLHPNVNSFRSNFKEEDYCNWLKRQSAGFEYCTWLLEENVLTIEEVFEPKLKPVLKHFINVVLQHGVTKPEGQQQTILHFLLLLQALKERVSLYPPEHWDLLKLVIFTPSKLGFDLDEAPVTEQLLSVLVSLLKYFSDYLTECDWNNFYQNLETVVSAPVFSHIITNNRLSVKNLEFLFALRVIEGSGLWHVFIKRIFFSMNEDVFISPIFKSLFVTRGETEFAVSLEPTCKLHLEEVLKVILKSSTELMGVIKCLDNQDEVQEEETGKTVKKGEFFLSLFKNTIFGFLESKHELFIEWVLKQKDVKSFSLLIQVLEHLPFGHSDLPLEIFVRWQDFENLKIAGTGQKKKFLLHLAVCSARIIGTPGCLKTSPVSDKIYDILGGKKLEDIDFSEIETIFSLLPFVSGFGEGLNDNDRLRTCLSKIEVDVSASGKPGESFRQSHFDVTLNGILQSLRATASLVVLDFVLSRAAWFNLFCKKEDVESALGVFGEARTPVAHSVKALELAYDYCFKHEITDLMPSMVYKLFLAPLMTMTPNAAVRQLMNKNLGNLCSLMSGYWEEDKSLMDILSNMLRKISAAGVFQTFIKKLSKEELDQMPKEKRQMLDATVKDVFFFLKKPYPPRVLKERYRKLMCEIFNMICCIVSARCVEEKFYKLFIFDDRGSFLFEVVDKTATYHLDMDFDEIPKRKKHLTILREAITPTFGRDSVKYIQTNTLFTSSLQEEVTRFDLTFSFIRPINSIPQTTKNVEIELEMDSLNSHECMATLIATISKMVRDKITPVDDVTELPCWLKFFMSVLRNPALSQNLRLFVLKAIYNLQEFVAAFCTQIFPELLNAMLTIFVDYPINYFLVDLIEMMVGWKHVPTDEKSRLQLTKLVEMILEKSDSLRRDIVKHNLEILKIMVQVWKNGMVLPQLSFTIFDRLSKSVEEDLKRGMDSDSVTYLNIHACGILLSNGIPAWKEGREGLFFDVIFKGFCEENKHNQLFGEICGQALNYLAQTKANALGAHEQSVKDKINSLPGCWLQLLYGVHKHYPKISSLFTFRIFSSAWDSMDSFTVKKLEMLLSHVSGAEAAEDATFDRHASAFVVDMLSSPDPEVQELSLRIAEKLCHKLEKDKLKAVTREVVRLQRSVHSSVRKWVYEIGRKLYGKTSDDVFPDCKIVLLRGLNDGVKELEEFCLQFWREVLNTTSPEIAFPKILSDMYSSDTEDIFLSNAARILLQLVEDDCNSKKELFLHPIIHRCKFRKRTLILGLRQSCLLSLASTGKSLSNQSLENVATIRHRNLPYLRPTISTLKFQPTVQEDAVEANIPAVQESKMPTNPFKRRFHKREAKTSFPFARWKNKNKKDGDRIFEKKDAEVDIIGEYRDGDYPDIQIRHSQIVRLLEVLSRKDHQIARLFLVSFYSGLTKAVGVEQLEALHSKTRSHFENILKSSGNFDPGVFGFILEVILNHAGSLDIDYQLVTNAAVSSNRVSLGALVLEQIIANKEGEDEKPSKKRRGCENDGEKRWLELARLYRSLEEFDVVSGIFLDKLHVLGNAKDAVRCESVWDWAEASRHYESTLRSNSESSHTEFYTESYLSCLAKLSNWSALNKCIRTTVNNDLDELWNNYYLLSWFLKSEMMISLGTDRNDFQKILKSFCKNIVKRDILGVNFGEEMTVFDWFSNNLQRANNRIDKLCLDFLGGWSHLDRWSYNLRAAKLMSLQTLSELSFAVRNLSEVSRSRVEQNIQEGVKRWERSMPAAGDDLTVWDVKLGYRREFFKRLKDFDLTTLDVKANLRLAKAALSQENLNLTKECLSRAKEKLPEGDFDLKAQHHICFNMGKMVVARLKMKDPKVGLDVYVNVWKDISKQILTAMETQSESSKTLLYSCNFTLGQLVADILLFAKEKTIPPETLTSLCQKLNLPESNVESELRKKGFDYFEAAIGALEKANCSCETKSKAYLELSKFLLQFSDSGRFEKLCEYILKSMGLGNPDARELFGCLLNMSQLLTDESPLEDVVAECERVPSWMFLTWINQMLTRLNSKLYHFLRPLLLRITHDYPNAIRYALKLMAEVKTQELKVKRFLSRLSAILSKDKLYEDFWNAVQFLAPPDLILSHYLHEALEEANRIRPDYTQIKKMIGNLQRIMFSSDFTKFRGPIFKFWEGFEDPLNDVLNGFESQEVLKRKIMNVLSTIEKVAMPSRRVLGLLESYSPWLSNFHALNVEGSLELPGQYRGGGQPNKRNLVTVSSFRNEVLMFDSKCKPMRISILGNDAREHKFLVKFGEDLRQDERIQQVFCHFNHRLKENKQTSRFSLDTYGVVPMTSLLGMIEWVDDTVSLYEMMETKLGNDSDAIAKAQSSHLAFLSQGSPLAVLGSVSGTAAAHLIAFESLKRENAISAFRAMAQRFPRDLLKKSFLDLSSSPEHFMYIRGNFATSHAITCVTHWLVGIGDRHLQNTLVSTKTGRVLGIDFGYAFGFATQFLTPPELLPFRLSPQILSVMHPLEESGWIKQTMIHCLRVFRKENFRLRSVLEVFAEEPVMNWLKQVKRNPHYQAENDAWYPREKLGLVEKKLSGANPVATYETDLRAGHSKSRYLKKYLEVLRGVPRDNIRARCPEEGLTEEQQVDCLIDLATDPHILGKTYIGWNPWL